MCISGLIKREDKMDSRGEREGDTDSIDDNGEES